MGVLPITPAAALVPLLVGVIRVRLGVKDCRKHGIGKLRRDLRDGTIEPSRGVEEILAFACAKCGKCSNPMD